MHNPILDTLLNYMRWEDRNFPRIPDNVGVVLDVEDAQGRLEHLIHRSTIAREHNVQ